MNIVSDHLRKLNSTKIDHRYQHHQLIIKTIYLVTMQINNNNEKKERISDNTA